MMKLLDYRSKYLLPFVTTPVIHHSNRIFNPFVEKRRFKTHYVRAALKVEILTIGRKNSKDAMYDSPIAELQKRMSRTMHINERTIQKENALTNIESARQRGSVILLDENGTLPSDSTQFANMVFKALEQGGSRLTFVIGDADGLSSDIKALDKAQRVQLLSLSTLTFTHKMIRLFLYEQLYRAVQIRAGTKYHRS